MDEEKKKLEVVAGDGSNLDISPVFEHTSAEKPQMNSEKPKNIVIPKVNSKKDEEDEKKEKKEEKPNE